MTPQSRHRLLYYSYSFENIRCNRNYFEKNDAKIQSAKNSIPKNTEIYNTHNIIRRQPDVFVKNDLRARGSMRYRAARENKK